MNNGRNGQYRNNRNANDSRRPYSDDIHRRGGYSQGRDDRYPNYDSSGYSRGRYAGINDTPSGYSGSRNRQYTDYDSSGYSRGRYADVNRAASGYPESRNRQYPDYDSPAYDPYDYYNSTDYAMYNDPSDGYSGSRNNGYSGSRSNGYSGSRSNGYSGSRNNGYSGSRSNDYSGSRSNGYSGERNDSRARKGAGSRSKGNTDKLPVSVFLGIGVTAIAVITLLISISVNSGKSKNRRQTYEDNTVSQSNVSGVTIVDVSDDETDIPDENTDSSQLEIQSFVGTWYKTDVVESNKSCFMVTMQYVDSFEFRLEIWNGSEKSAVITGTAFYTDETHADYSPKKKVKISFERGADYVAVTHTGSNSSFGIGSKYDIDGKFSELEPDYPVESSTSSETAPTVTYDYNLYKSQPVVNALSKTLNADDYALYKEMMESGLKSPIDYERTKDKNGRLVNVDAELNAVKYYAHLSSNGYDMIFICSDNANIYVLFYNSEEIVYYTNDKNYSSSMPASFQAVAKAKDIKPTFR